MEQIFTELKMSEDERIRKAIIQCVEDMRGQFEKLYSVHHKDAIAWLEKQGKKNPAYVEPKFKVGDWVVYNRNYHSREILQIYDIRDNRYYFNDNIHFSWSIKECDEKSHLWSIQDAKDGDVLVDVYGNIGIFEKRYGKNWHTYCYLGYEGRFVSEGGSHGSICDPATKEQRDLLFQKMKEDGYEWNAEKKELKEIIDKKQIKKNLQDNRFRRMFEQNPAWREEDERMLIDCFNNYDTTRKGRSL